MIILDRLPPDAIFVAFAAAVAGAIGSCLLIFALMRLRRSQTGAYYVLRKNQHRSAVNVLRLSLLLIAGAVTASIVAFMVPQDSRVLAEEARLVLGGAIGSPEPTSTPLPPSPTATSTPMPPTATATALPTATPTLAPPTATASVTSTPVATVASTVTPPVTATLAPSRTPTLEPSATPTSNPRGTPAPRKLSLNAISSAYDANERPVSPGTEFLAGTGTIFVFFDYANLPADIPIQHVWLLNGNNLTVQRVVWRKAGTGTGFVSFAAPGGFQPGLYQVRVLLDTEPMFVANFVVR